MYILVACGCSYSKVYNIYTLDRSVPKHIKSWSCFPNVVLTNAYISKPKLLRKPCWKWLLSSGTNICSQSERYGSKLLIWLLFMEPMVLLAKSSAFWLASTCSFTLYIVTDIALSETFAADSFDALWCLMKHSCTKPSAHLQAIQPSTVWWLYKSCTTVLLEAIVYTWTSGVTTRMHAHVQLHAITYY